MPEKYFVTDYDGIHEFDTIEDVKTFVAGNAYRYDDGALSVFKGVALSVNITTIVTIDGE